MLNFINKNKIEVNNSTYTIQTYAHANIVDSFVDPSNKIGSGSGEARLYVSSQSITPIFKFDANIPPINKGAKYYVACPNTCFLSKDNLVKYMEDAEIDYLSPNNHYRQDLSKLYQYRLDKVYSLTDEMTFHIYNQNGDFDSARFYIGSIDPAWSLLRELSLPNITYVNIYKLINDVNTAEILYYFELNHASSKSNTLVYSKKKSDAIAEYQIINDTSINDTEKHAFITARLGQGKFRTNVLSIMPKCPFTGISEPFLLRASHILPWSQCSTNYERIDGYNGLTLTPTYDILFDRGLISFSNGGSLLISPFLPNEIRVCLNLIEGYHYNICNFDSKRNFYLEYHRNIIFKK